MRLCHPTTPSSASTSDLFAGEDLLSADELLSDIISGGRGEGGSEFSSGTAFGSKTLVTPSPSRGSSSSRSPSGRFTWGRHFTAISASTIAPVLKLGICHQDEIQAEKQRILLLDMSKSAVESIRSEGRYDFIVEHDVKELGPHTLVCTALYNDGGSERKYLPQFFKFVVANPLSVRTKVRFVKFSHLWQEITFLEVCIGNHAKSNLYMDQVEPAYLEIFRPPVRIRAGGGIFSYFYQLRQSPQES